MSKNEFAQKRWMAIPTSVRKELEGNVFCGNCGVTHIIEYNVESDYGNIVLEGEYPG